MIARIRVLVERSFEKCSRIVTLYCVYVLLVVLWTSAKASADLQELGDQVRQVVNISSYLGILDQLCIDSSTSRLVKSLSIRLPFCNYTLALTLRGNQCLLGSASDCRECLLNSVVKHDLDAAEEFESFRKVIDNYDCGHGAHDDGDDEYDEEDIWSNKIFTCAQCGEFYKDWLCSVKLRVFVDSLWLPPCISLCRKVTEGCPFFVPELDDGSGEPLFFCSADELRYDESFFGKEQCYSECHLHRIRGQENFNVTSDCTDVGL